jgi:hypothetical protein
MAQPQIVTINMENVTETAVAGSAGAHAVCSVRSWSDCLPLSCAPRDPRPGTTGGGGLVILSVDRQVGGTSRASTRSCSLELREAMIALLSGANRPLA